MEKEDSYEHLVSLMLNIIKLRKCKRVGSPSGVLICLTQLGVNYKRILLVAIHKNYC